MVTSPSLKNMELKLLFHVKIYKFKCINTCQQSTVFQYQRIRQLLKKRYVLFFYFILFYLSVATVFLSGFFSPEVLLFNKDYNIIQLLVFYVTKCKLNLHKRDNVFTDGQYKVIIFDGFGTEYCVSSCTGTIITVCRLIFSVLL